MSITRESMNFSGHFIKNTGLENNSVRIPSEEILFSFRVG